MKCIYTKFKVSMCRTVEITLVSADIGEAHSEMGIPARPNVTLEYFGLPGPARMLFPSEKPAQFGPGANIF